MLPTPERSPLTLAEPSKERPQRVRAVCSLLAVEAFPLSAAVMVAGSFRVTLAEPFTLVAAPAPPPLLLAIAMFLAVPQ